MATIAGPGWFKGDMILFQLSCVQGPQGLAILFCLPRCGSRELNQKWGNQD